MADASESRAENKAQLEIDQAIEAENKALLDFKASITEGFKALHHTSKFEVIAYLSELSREEKDRFYWGEMTQESSAMVATLHAEESTPCYPESGVCPHCNSEHTEYQPYYDYWVCQKCSSVWTTDDFWYLSPVN